jgi:ribosomal protein S18 acetylase RimI-like enzyme
MLRNGVDEMCVEVTPIAKHDIGKIIEIEQQSFIDPWIPEVIAWSLTRSQSAHGIAAKYHDEVVGYAIFHLEGIGPDSILRVSRLAVAKNVTRCGIGGILLDSLLGRLTLTRPTLVFPVRESNTVAQLWLKQYGLTCVEIVRGRYADGEDGYIFEIGYADAREYLG